MSHELYDVLIIGAGGAGLSAAIYAKQKNKKVAVISKIHPLKSHTVAAQGGINAVLGNIEKDEIIWHIYDTIKASDFVADHDSVKQMCEMAPSVIKFLYELGVDFDKNEDGKIDQKIYGGQSTDFGRGTMAKRACYSKDRTGEAIMHKLYEEAIELGVEFYNYYFALDLIINERRVFGCVCFNIENGEIVFFESINTIIATGGYSQIYATSTSATSCTGDGNALIARCGFSLQDMEFVQFHPTAIRGVGILITEAARSAGGILLNGVGERFMSRYAEKFLELAPRDLVARAISTEIVEGRGAGPLRDHVLLDLTFLTKDEIQTNLPAIYENCIKFIKLDPSQEMIPIAPAAHYNMGGIPTNNMCQVVSNDTDEIIHGLFAIGEVASMSVHGANRLGCNSLLDLIVSSKIAVENLREIRHIHALDSNKIVKSYYKKIHSLLGYSEINLDEILSKLKTIFDIYVGVFRTEAGLNEALKELNCIKNEFSKYKIQDKELAWNTNLIQYFEIANMLISAEATIISALWRKESRGAHYRHDYNKRDSYYQCHSLFSLNSGIVNKRSVRTLKEYVDFFQDESRNY